MKDRNEAPKEVSNSRYKFIDIAKGMGIILVLMGHFFIYRSPVTQVIYSFHMPLFFILSGIFLKGPDVDNEGIRGVGRYVWKKTKRLGLMYVLFFVLSVAAVAVFDRKTYPLKRIIRAFLGERLRTFHMGPIWFLLALYIIVLIYGFLYVCKCSKWNSWVKLILMLVLLLGAYRLPEYMERFEWSFAPLFINVIPMGLFFVLLGICFRKEILEIPSVSIGTRCIITVVAVALTFVLSFRYLGFMEFMTGGFGEDLFIFMFAAIAGTIAIVFGSSLLANHWPGTALAYVGKHTMVLLGLHRIVSYYCTKIFYAIFKIKIAPAISLPDRYAFLWTIFILLIILGLDAFIHWGAAKYKEIIRICVRQ